MFKKIGNVIVCCVMSLLLMFGSILGTNDAIFGQTQNLNCESAKLMGYYQETFDLYPNRLKNYDRVFLTGIVNYTPSYDDYGNKYFYSVDNVSTWITGEDAYDYTWVPTYWEWYVSDDSRCISIDVHGVLYEPFLWWTVKTHVCKTFTYSF